MGVLEIERAIAQLSPEDLAKLAAWFARYHQDRWDQRIEDDLKAGRLDSLVAEVTREYDNGEARPL